MRFGDGENAFPGIVFTDDADGATDISECPHHGSGWCKHTCGACAICGHGKHNAVHGPLYGQPPGSAPWAHKFVAGSDLEGGTPTPRERA